MTEGALWIVGGLDPSAGAGVLRDVATARSVAPELRVHVVVTALTQQGDGQPATVQPCDERALRFQLERVPKPAAIKVGLLPQQVVDAMGALLPDAPTVVDPVLGATAGGDLGVDGDALAAVFEGALVTPNRREAHELLRGLEPATWLEKTGALALLIKSDRSAPHEVLDTLHTARGAHAITRPRRQGPDPRGTGCALSTAIACGLAAGATLPEAVEHAIAWLDEARTRARDVGGQTLL